MIWILLLYVLPLVLSVIVCYCFAKQDGGTVKDFVKIAPILLIPLANILVLIVGLFAIIEDWVENDETIQNFLNKKL